MVFFIVKYVEIDSRVYSSAPDPGWRWRGDGHGDTSSSWHWLLGRSSDADLFFPVQCTREEPRVLREARRAPSQSSVRYAVCSRVFNNSGPDGSRDRAVARMRGQMLGSIVPLFNEDPLSVMAGGGKFNASEGILTGKGPRRARNLHHSWHCAPT